MLARLKHLGRPARVILCGVATMMIMPVLSSLGISIVPLTIIAIAWYVLGWFFWLGFAAELPEVSSGALLYLAISNATFILWAIYDLVILLVIA